MAICGIVVDLAHFNIQKVFTALANLVQLQGVEQAVLYCFFFTCGIFIYLVLMAITWPQKWEQSP